MSVRRVLLFSVLLLLVLLISVPISMRVAVAPYIKQSVDQSPPAEIALVLGASVIRGVPSPFLAERADSAIALYKAGKVSKILVTGDDGEHAQDEVTPVRKYLLDRGVKSQDIFLDHAGFDTYSSMYRTREIFHAQSLVIVTQDFHLPRSLWIARELGLNAYGLPTAGSKGSAYDYVREIPASMKAIVDVLTHRLPQYLGAPVDLSSNGEATWPRAASAQSQ